LGFAIAIGIVVCVTLAAIGVMVKVRTTHLQAEATCKASNGQVTFQRPPDQMMLASDIAAVGVRARLPDHAITIALATAMQESGLRNLPAGDRDSVGVLQQRPSQGWGTKAQLLNPEFAASAFYRRLQQVPSWDRLEVTAAAQAVQRSARPDAYRQWEPEARALAKAFTGESGAALRCQGLPRRSARASAEAGPAEAAATGGPAPGATASNKQGWVAATWLVAHAGSLGITSVSFLGQRWTAANGDWQPVQPARPVVTFEPAQTSRQP